MNVSVWVAVVALVAAVNPARVAVVAGGLGAEVRWRSSATWTAAGGAAAASGVYLAIAVVAGPLLDAIDVSVPTIMVAVGLVLLAAGAKDLLLGPPPSEPALPGWRSMLVPVMVPAALRPHGGLLVLGVAGAYGLWPVAVGAAATVGAVAGASAMGPDGVGSRVLRWLTAMAAVLTAAAGATFAVDGVFSV